MKLIYKWLIFAWKNIWRNRRRSLTTLGISAIGITGILFFGGFALYTYQSLEEFSARQQGHVLLAQHDYFDKEETTPLALGLSDWQDKQSLLKNIQGVRRVLPRTSFSGLISNGDKSTIFIGDGVDAKHEFTVTGPFMEVTHGDILSPNDGDMPQVMLATGLAKNLNATIGSSLTLLSTTTDGALNGVDVTVVGIFSTGVPEMDKRKLFVSLATTQSLLNSTKVSLLAVYLKNTQDTHIVETKIKQLFAELSTRNWFDLAFFYHKVRDLYDRIFSVVGLVILIVVLLSVINTLSMAIMERTREIGNLSAMGTFQSELLSIFVLEAALLGLMGACSGMLITGGLTVYLQFAEFIMPPPPGMTQGYPLSIAFSLPMYLKTSAALVIVIILGAFLTARKGINKPIIEALTHV